MSSPAQMVPPELAEGVNVSPRQDDQEILNAIPWLPCVLSLELSIAKFSIGDLLALAPGSIFETACHHTSDVPLRVNGTLIAWTEFDVIDERLAVRITDQA